MEEAVGEFRSIMADQLAEILSGKSTFTFSREIIAAWWDEQPEKSDAFRVAIKEETLRLRSQCEEMFIEIPKLVL
jgi:hypothetical protein